MNSTEARAMIYGDTRDAVAFSQAQLDARIADPWAHVEPSTYTAERKYDQGVRNPTGSITPPCHIGTMFRHPCLNGGHHCVWVWQNGEAFEFWRASNGAVVGGPRAL